VVVAEAEGPDILLDRSRSSISRVAWTYGTTSARVSAIWRSRYGGTN
jgi:hypothetical protein